LAVLSGSPAFGSPAFGSPVAAEEPSVLELLLGDPFVEVAAEALDEEEPVSALEAVSAAEALEEESSLLLAVAVLVPALLLLSSDTATPPIGGIVTVGEAVVSAKGGFSVGI
jgi:hypothetical protein